MGEGLERDVFDHAANAGIDADPDMDGSRREAEGIDCDADRKERHGRQAEPADASFHLLRPPPIS